ncbi:MAG: oxygenase MpaB family protein [Pseudoxanthomonas sp.]
MAVPPVVNSIASKPPLLARVLRRWVLRAFPRGRSGIDFDTPAGDPGLFGPDSVTWRIHADFPGMLSGGLSALALQTLHPRALAGVYDHSNFRDDLVGRLRRTTAFVAGTTYAGRAQAAALIERVRQIHTQVRGHTADGQAYAATDPELLTWVHVTEAHGFLQGYARYCRPIPPTLADAYYAEGRGVAMALGARDVPGSVAEVEAYFARVLPQLRCDARSREVLDILQRIRLPVPMPGLSRDLFLGAGLALLPEWANALLGRTWLQRRGDRLRAALLAWMAPMFRLALMDGTYALACTRVGRAVEAMHEWPEQASLPGRTPGRLMA